MNIKKQKQNIGKLLGGMLVFVAVFMVTASIKAGITENTTGWIWNGSEEVADGVVNGNESGVGLLSMNNITGGGSISYGVNIPAVGQITGYAYSENVGAIDFNPHSGCPGSPKYDGACEPYPANPSCSPGTCPITDAMRNADGTFTGWARFVEISKANAANNSGGWTGWIKLSGTALNGSGYGVKIESDNKLSGYGYSNELGSIAFAGAVIPPPPTVTLTASPLTINLDSVSLPQNVTLTWVIAGTTTCTKSGGTWSGTINASGNETISQSTATVDYVLTCTGIADSIKVNVTTGCNKKECSGATCGSTFMVTGTSTIDTCTDASTCSSDADCTARSATGWKEVAP